MTTTLSGRSAAEPDDRPEIGAGFLVAACIAAALTAPIARIVLGRLLEMNIQREEPIISQFAQPWLPGAIAVAVAFVVASRSSRAGPAAAFVVGILIGLTIAYASMYLDDVVIPRIARLPAWDAGGFVIFGRAASHGNPYDIAFIHDQAVLYPYQKVTDGFVEELQPLYPPATQLLFLPLGWFETIQSAAAFWYMVQLTAVIGAIFLAWRVFLADLGVMGAAISATLILSLTATLDNLKFAQTDALLLCTAILATYAGARWTAGLWIGFGMVVKPLMVILAVGPLVRRRFGALAAVALTYGGASLLAALLFGMDQVLLYLAQPTLKLGEYKFTQHVNASLTGALRTVRDAIGHLPFFDSGTASLRADPNANAFFLGLALAAMLATVYLYDRKDRLPELFGPALLVPVALMVYPATLNHYMLLVVVPMLAIWKMRELVGISGWTFGAFVFAIFVVTGVFEGDLAAFAAILAWGLSVAMAIRLIRRPEPEADASRDDLFSQPARRVTSGGAA